MDNLRHELTEAVTALRQRLADADIGSNFRLDIEVSGRIQGGEVKVAYVLGDSYSSTNARGARLGPVVTEFLRRHGWNEANTPLALEAPAPLEEPVAEHPEEVAF